MRIYRSPVPPPVIPNQLIFDYLFPSDVSNSVYPVPSASRPALIDGVTGRTLTRGQVGDQCRRVASGLAALGLRRGDVVCLFGANSIEYILAMLGCQAAGFIVTPANYG